MILKIKISILIYLIGFGSIYAQKNIISYILDSESKEPIPYVNISILNSNNGTVSDLKGNFDISGTSLKDSIILSSIGYETQKVGLSNISEEHPILMNLIDYVIDEVQISGGTFDQEMILGERNENGRGNSFGFGSAQLGTELGALIKIERNIHKECEFCAESCERR